TEPGVEHVGVLLPVFGIAWRSRVAPDFVWLDFGFRISDFGFSVPHRNSMAPPKLAADAPILNIIHPVVIDLRPALREEAHFFGERARLGRSGGRPVRRTHARRAAGGGADGRGRGSGWLRGVRT